VTPRPTRRQLALTVFVTLLLLHVGAYALIQLRMRQSALANLYRDAREQWASGHRDLAAAEYRRFIAERPAAGRPFLLLRGLPSEASGWFVLGRIQAESHQTDEALADFEQAMQLDPTLGRREFRDLLLEAHRPERLRDDADRRLAADPHSPVAAKDLGAAWLALDEPSRAVAAYRQALADLPAYLARVDPGHPTGLTTQEANLLNLLSVAERLAGRANAADAACDEVSRRQPRRVTLDRLCRAYALDALGQHAKALELLQGYQPPAPEHEALMLALSQEKRAP